MRLSRARRIVCGILIALVPASLWATDPGPAMLYAKGAAWINGSAVPRTSAVFPGDMVQTRSDSMANINASGSNVVVLADSLVKFDGSAVSLEHGGMTVATSNGMSARSGEVTVVPASTGWTEFESEAGSGRHGSGRSAKGRRKRQRWRRNLDGCAGAADHRRRLPGKEEEKEEKGRRGDSAPAVSVLDSPIVIYGGAAWLAAF